LQCLAPAALALLLAAPRGAAALRKPQQPTVLPPLLRHRVVEGCNVEQDSLLDDDLPRDKGITLQRYTAEERAMMDSQMRQYEGNLSHVRECKGTVDHTWNLAPLIVPSLKLAFCYVPKVACSQFKDLFNRLNKLNAAEGFGKFWTYGTSSHISLKVNRSVITKENGWKFAIFTRDPALRYLSSFGSTCVSKTDHASFEHRFECCGPVIEDNTMPAEQLIKMFEKRVDYDAWLGVPHRDDHWESQVAILKQCGWDKFAPDKVDYYGQMDGDMNRKVKEMLEMVNGIDDWMLSHVDRLFPRKGIAGHQSPVRKIPPELFFRNRTVLESVMRIYEDDYELLPRAGCSFTEHHLQKSKHQMNVEFGTMRRDYERQRREQKRQTKAKESEK